MNLEEQIRAACKRGMIPFILVLPVMPEALRGVADADRIVGQLAAEAIAEQVRLWQEQDNAS